MVKRLRALAALQILPGVVIGVGGVVRLLDGPLRIDPQHINTNETFADVVRELRSGFVLSSVEFYAIVAALTIGWSMVGSLVRGFIDPNDPRWAYTRTG